MIPVGAVAAPVLRPVKLPPLGPAKPSDFAVETTIEAVRVTGEQAAGQRLFGARFLEVSWEGAVLDGTDLSRARFLDNTFADLDCSALEAPSSHWRAVEMRDCRIGAAALDRADLQSVRASGCRFGYLNLHAAQVADVLLTDCQIDTLEATAATLQRVRFSGCRIGTLTLSSALCSDVDLRGADLEQLVGLDSLAGAVISDAQLYDLAPALAEHLGIRVDTSV